MTRGVRTLGWACRIDASGGLPAKCVSSALRLRGFSNGGVPVARAPRPSLPAATVPHAARAVQSQPAADQWSRTHPVAGLDDTEASVQRKQRAAHSAPCGLHLLVSLALACRQAAMRAAAPPNRPLLHCGRGEQQLRAAGQQLGQAADLIGSMLCATLADAVPPCLWCRARPRRAIGEAAAARPPGRRS